MFVVKFFQFFLSVNKKASGQRRTLPEALTDSGLKTVRHGQFRIRFDMTTKIAIMTA